MSSVFFSRLSASGTTSSVLVVEKNRINRANLLVYWLCELTFRGGFSKRTGFRNNTENSRNKPVRFEKVCAIYVYLCVPQRLAPPQKKKLSWFLIIPIIFLFSFIKPTFSLGTVILIGLAVIMPIKIWFTYYNTMIYPKQMHKWRSAWYCSTCGTVSVINLD
ncbi:hypothetical protein NIES4106_58140 (plasmid) [Fischerella sp. NIES-4106]|nr:hypothetical protein NIES4106_58140 [Fischerella sp. NIES-4106]